MNQLKKGPARPKPRPFKIPKSKEAKLDLIRSLTAKIQSHVGVFGKNPNTFHDGQAKRALDRHIENRAKVLRALKKQNEALYARALGEIQSESN